MQKRRIGSSTLEISVVGLGANNFGSRVDLEGTRAVVHKCLDLGVTFIDTADAYGGNGASETCLGEVLGPRRKEVVLATKFGLDPGGSNKVVGASRAYIMQAVEASLKRLRTDWIDFYQMHYPDPATPIEETLRALDDLIKQGKVRHIGCSNVTAAIVNDASRTAKQHKLAAFIGSQDQYSLLVRGVEKELIPALEANGMGFVPYFPLASGLLTGKYKRGAPMPEGSRLSYSKRHIERFVNDRNMQMVEELRAFAEKRGHTLLELAFAWLLNKPLIASVISGASTPAQVEQNVKAVVDWKLSPADLAEIDRITL
jgi:aryl-alcohol dehydrogenase-like predicted oxidoreductase